MPVAQALVIVYYEKGTIPRALRTIEEILQFWYPRNLRNRTLPRRNGATGLRWGGLVSRLPRPGTRAQAGRTARSRSRRTAATLIPKPRPAPRTLVLARRGLRERRRSWRGQSRRVDGVRRRGGAYGDGAERGGPWLRLPPRRCSTPRSLVVNPARARSPTSRSSFRYATTVNPTRARSPPNHG